MKVFDYVYDVLFNFEILSLHCEIGQILTDSKSTRNEQGVPILGSEFLKRFDVTTGNPGGLDHNIPLILFNVLSIKMVNDVHLISIGCKALDLSHLLTQSNEKRSGFGDLGSVLSATSVQ